MKGAEPEAENKVAEEKRMEGVEGMDLDAEKGGLAAETEGEKGGECDIVAMENKEADSSAKQPKQEKAMAKKRKFKDESQPSVAVGEREGGIPCVPVVTRQEQQDYKNAKKGVSKLAKAKAAKAVAVNDLAEVEAAAGEGQGRGRGRGRASRRSWPRQPERLLQSALAAWSLPSTWWQVLETKARTRARMGARAARTARAETRAALWWQTKRRRRSGGSLWRSTLGLGTG